MPTLWVHTVHVICAADAMPGAIGALDLAFPCDDKTPRNTAHPERYGCQLSADGKTPATHYGASFSVTEEIRQRLEAMGLDKTPGINYWRCSNPEGILQTSNWPNQQTGIPFVFDDSATVMGLQRVQSEYPI